MGLVKTKRPQSLARYLGRSKATALGVKRKILLWLREQPGPGVQKRSYEVFRDFKRGKGTDDSDINY